MSAPIPFDGSPEERMANRETHDWAHDYDEIVCLACDAKPWHAAAEYPCGVEPPRTDDPEFVDQSIGRFAAYAAVRSVADRIAPEEVF